MLRTMVKALAWSLLALVVSVAVAVAAPRWTEPLSGPIRTGFVRAVGALVSTFIDGSLRVGSLQGSILKDPTLADITLKDADGETVLSIEELRLRYSLRGFLQGRLHIQAAEIVAPRLNLIQEPDGRLNLERVLSLESEPSEDAPSSLTVTLDRLVVTAGRIRLGLPAVPGTRSIEDIRLQLQGQFDPQGFRMVLQDLGARAEPSAVVLKTLRGTVSQTADTLRFEDWLLQTGASTVTLSGAFPLHLFASERRPELPASSAAKPPSNAASQGAALGAAPSSEPKLTLALHPLDVAEIGRILGDSTLRGELAGEITTAQNDDALTVLGRLTAAEGALELAAALHPKRLPTAYDATLTVSALDLSALAEKPGLASDINLRLQITGEGFAPADRRARLRLGLERSHLGAIAIEPSEIRLQARGERVEVNAFDLNTSILEANLEGEIDLAGHSNLRYAVSLAPADLRELIAANALGGQLALTGQLQGEWPRVATRGVLTGADLVYDQTRLETLELAYEALDLGEQPQADARLQAQQIRVAGLGIEELAAQAAYAYKNATHHLRFSGETDASSALYVHLAGAVAANDQRQTLRIAAFEARLEEHTWRATAPLQAVRSAEELRLQPFRLTHDREAIEVAGALVGDALQNVRVQVTELDLNFLQRVFSLPPVVAGRASGQAEVSGKLTAPILKSTATLRSSGEQTLPLERAHVALRYANGQLDTDLSLTQAGRETVALQSALPLDLGLVAKPIEQRLRDDPLHITLTLARPDLAVLNQALPALPAVSGTLEGTFTIAGRYDRFTVASNAKLQRLGIADAVSQLDGPLQLAAPVITAPSVAALRQAIAVKATTVTVPALTFRVPSLTGQLEGGESMTPLALRDTGAEVSATWDGNALTRASSLLELHAQVGSLPAMKFTSKARLESQQLTVEQVTLKTPASRLNGAGQINLDDRSMQFSLAIPQLQLREFEGLVPPELPSVVAGTVDIGGTLETPKLAARLRYAGARLNADASARLQEPQQPYRARVRISRLELAPFAPNVSGQLRAQLEVQGSGLTEDTPEARLSLDVESTGFNLAPGLAARVRSRVTGATVGVDLFDVTSEPFEMSARGSFSTSAPTDLRYQLVVRDLAAVAAQLGVELQATGELTGRVSGAFDALRAQSKLALKDWRYGPWQGSALRASVAGKTLTSAPAVTLQASATGVQGPQLPPSALGLEGRFANDTGSFALKVTDGPFSHSLVAGVVDTEPALQLRIDPLRLQTEQWSWNNAQPIEIVYEDQETLVLRRLELNNAASRLSAQGTFSPQGAIGGRVRIQDLPIQPMVNTFAPSAPIPQGTLSLDVQVNGTASEPQLDGTVQLASMQWSEQPLGDVRAQITSRGAAFRGEAQWVDDGEVLLSVTARRDTDAPQALAASIEAPRFDLARLQGLSPDIQESAGRLRIDVQLRGTLDRPTADGVIELQDGRLRHSAIGEPYTDLQARAVFKGNRLDIERFQAASGAGTARLQGWLETRGQALGRANLTLNANEFTAINTQALEAVVSSNVTLRGSQEALTTSGNVTVPRARIRYEDLPGTGPSEVEPWELTVAGVYGPGPEAATFEAAAASTAAEPEAPPLSFLRADLQLDMPRNVWIQGKGTAIELSGRLQLKKDQSRPFVLTGEVETLRGFATFLGRKFNVEKGIVTFTGSEDVNPVLDISASYEVADYTVYVNVTGESKEPEITYNSEPELDQQDILSLLIFGKTSDRLTRSEQTTLGSKAQQFAGGLAAGMLEQTVGKALGLDTVAIELGDQGSASSVGAGRYLTQNIYVEYQRKFHDPRQGNRTGNAVTVEYSISRGLKVEATGSDYGETAIDFVWSHDY